MTYFGFLALFLGVPILFLIGLAWRDKRNGRHITAVLSALPFRWVLLLHIIIALTYTTPWDNYLVATRVWWYDPNLVTGIVFGWVPIEEYTFFIVQPIFTGLWLYTLARYITPEPINTSRRSEKMFRRFSLLFVGLVWLGSIAILLSGWRPGTYLGLELGWALPPVMLQLWFGGHLLWRYRRLVGWTLIPTTLYLSAADALAIQSGTWAINPAQSLEWLIGGILPIEEMLFFLLTNTLLTFGITLAMARASQGRLEELRLRFFPLSKQGNTAVKHDGQI